jgi:hypothetical protein
MSETPGSGWPNQPPEQQPETVQPQPGWAGTQPDPGAGLAPTGEPVLVTIGDISVTQSQVFTPSGARPLSEVTFNVTDMSTTSQAIPVWAIVCAIVFALACLLGLLFLLVKETRVQGSMQVTVQGPGFVHTSQIPVTSPAQIADINARVNHARMLTAAQHPGQQPGQPGGFGQPGSQPGWGDAPGQEGSPGQQPTQGW